MSLSAQNVRLALMTFNPYCYTYGSMAVRLAWFPDLHSHRENTSQASSCDSLLDFVICYKPPLQTQHLDFKIDISDLPSSRPRDRVCDLGRFRDLINIYTPPLQTQHLDFKIDISDLRSSRPRDRVCDLGRFRDLINIYTQSNLPSSSTRPCL